MNSIQKKNINFQLEYSIYSVKSVDEAYFLGKPCKSFWNKKKCKMCSRIVTNKQLFSVD
jgi:hypothetical protein